MVHDLRFLTSTPLGALFLLVASDVYLYACMYVCHTSSWTTEEQLQSGITTGSEYRID